MTQVLVDAQLASRLQSAATPLELCDPNGKVVGHFTPLASRRIQVPFSEEDITKSKKEKGGRPLADILADLEKS